ncbi:MAG TPA: lysylphosphatidylglycerol synthase transmembrane domain-containing protein [Segetibacter sp.]|jgi:hypothetical protein
MKRKILGFLKYMLFLGLGIFLVWWSLSGIPDDKWVDFKKAFATARYWLLIPVFFILIASHLLRALRWRILMQPLGYYPTLGNTFFAVMIGYLANLAVPRLGEVLKCTILARYEKVPAEKLVGTIVAERAFDVVSLGIIFLLAFVFQFDVVGEYGMSLIQPLFTSKTGEVSYTKALIAVAILVVIIIIIKVWFYKFAHLKLVIFIKKVIKGIWEGVISVRGLKRKLPFVICSIGIWGLYLLGTWVGFYATVGTSGMGLDVALSALAFASVGMIITPGGIGAYAFFMAKVLEKNGVPFELGFANGTLQWFAQFLLVLIVGFISLGLLPYFNKKKHTNAESGYHPNKDLQP